MKPKKVQNIYQRTQKFADLTKQLIINGNIRRAKRCIQVAEQLFNTGNSEVRNAISNVYVFSISVFMEIHHCNINGLLPFGLRNEYYKQVNTSGI